MSKIDYQALREKAEKATWGDWDSYKPHRGARGYEVRLSSQAIAQHVLKNNAEFIAAFNPKVALALLDEREAKDKVWSAQDNHINQQADRIESLEKKNGELGRALEAAEKRIAELEAEPVSQTYNLPELIEGMEVSIDVSTCDADLGNRYFGTVTEVSELDAAKNGYILLVQDAEPNFDVNCNSPVTPDGWISCSDRMPDKLIPVMVMYEDGEMWSAMWNGNRWDDGTEYPDPHSVTHWREMPAAPKQEVKS
ncbi:ead/Ea22-like family protein [Escherichia coli]|uniref:ead/Ea22-like family protein n=1 Tax=Escherichia coli TaxID=562 RepID=UPI0025AB6ADE|nr:ead/Ea22-like family protein [Escherichia coli]WJS26256.1 ead/Ea22-like family protein [Escherichia coli]